MLNIKNFRMFVPVGLSFGTMPNMIVLKLGQPPIQFYQPFGTIKHDCSAIITYLFIKIIVLDVRKHYIC